MSEKKSDPIEIESLNADDLDIEELERRIELAGLTADPMAWICGADGVCGVHGCDTFCGANCPSNCVGLCGTFCGANGCNELYLEE